MSLWASENAGGSGGGPISSTDITDSSSTGRAVLTGTQAQGRAALGAGTSNFSGAYADLTGKPTLGSAAAAATSDFATVAQGTKADAAQPKIGNPVAFTSRALTAADDGALLVSATAQVATLNTGIGAAGFNGVYFYGPVSFAGTAPTLDKRQSGLGYDFCTVVRTNVGGSDTFLATGAKN